jgi:hypothetical protein
MVDIKTKRMQSESSSEDALDRVELMWDSRNQDLIIHWGNECKANAKLHHKAGKRFKWLYSIIGVPTMLIPVLVGSFASQLAVSPITQSILMLCSGALSTVSQFFDFSGRSAAHFEYEARYSELASEIDVELVKPKARRLACDVYLERVLSARNRLGSSAPVL